MTLRLWQRFKPALHRARVDHRLRDAGASAGAGAGRDGDGRHPGRSGRRCRGCRTPLPRRMAGLEAEIQELAGAAVQRRHRPSSSARSSSTGWACPAARRARPAPMPPAPTCWRIWPPRDIDLPARVLDWRQISKLKSTYTDALQTHINPETGRVHTSYSIAGANDRAARLDRPQPAEHSGPHRRGTAHPRGLRRRPGNAAGQPRLQPDRAAHPGPCRRYSAR